MKSFILTLFCALPFFLTGCFLDDTDQDPSPQKPTLTYPDTTFDIVFFTPGSSGAPELDWNGDQGSFS